jgi:ABC-2 type transport system permease protein
MGFLAGFRNEWARIARTRFDLLFLTVFPIALLGSMAAMIWGGSLRDLPVVVVDRDGGPLAREITRNIAATPTLHLIGQVEQPAEALALVRTERAVAYVVIPKGVGTRVAEGAPVEIFYEAVFLSTGSLASTYLRLVTELTLAEQIPQDTGTTGAPLMVRALPTVEVSLLGNPTLSFEWYLGMLIGPSVLHLLIAISCVGSLSALLQEKSFATFVRTHRRPGAMLMGRLTVHAVIGVAWGVAWLLWMTLARGYRVDGSAGVIVLGLGLLFVATASIALLAMAVTREVGVSLSAMVVIAGSALAYSGATLPLAGGLWFARNWSEVLPLTHFILVQLDQMTGTAPVASRGPVIALLLYPLIAGGVGMLLVLRSGRTR